MIENRTYDDPIKSVSRQKMFDFCSYHFRNRDARKLRVLCFPGAETEGEEALEVREVYDRIGIPRRNVVGLEYNKKKAERLRKACLDIEVRCQDDVSFFQETDRAFDIISLDYTSNFGDLQRYAIDLIAARKLLGKRGILITNFFGARENESTAFDLTFSQRIESAGIDFIEFAEDTTECMNKIRNQPYDLKYSRSRGIQEGIAGSLLHGKSSIDPFLIRRVLNPKDMQDIYDFAKELSIRKFNGIRVAGRNDLERVARLIEFRAHERADFYSSIGTKFNKNYHAMLLLMGIEEPYFVLDHKAYSYVSNKGSPMLMDMFFLDTFSERFRKDFFEVKHNGKYTYVNVCPKYSGRKREKLEENAEKLAIDILKTRELFLVEREFLGSSYVPKPRINVEEDTRDKISKNEAIELLAAGIPINEILETFSGFSEGQLRAFRAHITMGTYNREYET